MHRFIEQDDTFNYWYDIYAVLYTPSPGGWGIFLKTPGDPGAGDLKTQNTPGPQGGGFFLSRGMASLGPESLLLGLKTWYTNGSSSRMQTMHSNSFSG